MNKFFLSITFILIVQLAKGQEYRSEFENYFQLNDTINQLRVLKAWKESNPKDPELYTSFFNYHFSKAMQEVIELTPNEPGGDRLVIVDSLGQDIGYMGNRILFDPYEINKGLEIIEEGIERYPNRLDMRFGKTYVLGETEQWENFTHEIIRTIQYGATNNHQWTWTDNESIEDGKDFLLSSVQEYQIQLYQTGREDLLADMGKIAQEVLKMYPDHVESLTNLAITYVITEKYELAIESLLKAEKINPKDTIVLLNLAHAFRLNGKINEAIGCYEKVKKVGDAEEIAYAEKQIEELKNE